MRLSFVAASVVGAALAVPATAAADVTIQAVDGSNTWAPANVVITAGETVNWSFAGTATFHNVASDATGAAWEFRSPPTMGGATVSRKFDAVGIYTFVCELHRSTMTGTVDVRGASGETAAPLPPPPISEQPFVNDTGPLSTLEVRDTVAPKLDRVKVSRVTRGVRVRYRLSEAGKVSVKLTRGGRTVKTRTAEVRKGSGSVVVRGLKSGRYRVQVRARDFAGNAAKARARASLTVRS